MSQDEGIQERGRKDKLQADSREAMERIYTDVVQIDCRTGNCIYIKDRDGVAERLYTEYKWYKLREHVMKKVCPEDLERCRAFTSIENLQRVSGGEVSSDTCTFRKIYSGEYCLVQAVIIPHVSGDDCVVICTRNADASVKAEEHHKRQLFRELQKAREAELARAEFMRYASNELSTAMEAVFGRECKEAEEPGDWERAGRMGRYITTRMKDLVTLSDLREQRIQIRREKFELETLLEDCGEYVKGRKENEDISYELQVHPGLQKVYLGDVMRLMQVLFSLLANAFDYNQAGGCVRLEAGLEEHSESADRVFFLVSDTGRGIGEEFLPILFDRFTQEKPEHGKCAKAGLGLLLVKIVLDSMGGSIEVDTTPGEGSSFRVSVPLMHPEWEGSERVCGGGMLSMPVRTGKAGKRVLLVDDNEINLEMAAEQLQETGYAVVGCLDGGAALRTFACSMAGTFDIVLTDMEMPGMDGMELAGKIRELSHPDSRKVCILGMSAKAGMWRREKGKPNWFEDILGKPFDVREFGFLSRSTKQGYE